MERIIAYCGLICSDCPAYIATQVDDKEKMKELANLWSNDKYTFDPEDICCDGCGKDSRRVFKWCNECNIRICGMSRNVKNCAYCKDFPCVKLDKVPPENKANLTKIKDTIPNQ
jgi:hypothetical protein